jgi:phosphatidylglycerol:prolipoprotein diacylglycerol transferase
LLVAKKENMYPELFHFGSFTVYGYGFCIMLGAFLGYLYLLREGNLYNLSSDKAAQMAMLIFVASYLGGKVFLWIASWDYYMQNPAKMFEINGSGFVFYGSFIFSIAGLLVFFKLNKLKPDAMLDILAVTVAIVHGFGKVGCFLAGCCYGISCNPSVGVIYTNSKSIAPLHVSLYPVQLIDAAIIFGCLLLILLAKKNKALTGKYMLIYGIVYSTGRFFTEFIRGDDGRGYWGPLSQSQWIGIVVILFCMVLFFRQPTLPKYHK